MTEAQENELAGMITDVAIDYANGHAVDFRIAAKAAIAFVNESSTLLSRIRAHIDDYHYALDSREHGGIAQNMAFNSICKELDAYWVQGEEAKRRATQTKTE